VFHAKPRNKRNRDASQAFGAFSIRLKFKHETPHLYCIERGPGGESGKVKRETSKVKRELKMNRVLVTRWREAGDIKYRTRNGDLRMMDYPNNQFPVNE